MNFRGRERYVKKLIQISLHYSPRRWHLPTRTHNQIDGIKTPLCVYKRESKPTPKSIEFIDTMRRSFHAHQLYKKIPEILPQDGFNME